MIGNWLPRTWRLHFSTRRWLRLWKTAQKETSCLPSSRRRCWSAWTSHVRTRYGWLRRRSMAWDRLQDVGAYIETRSWRAFVWKDATWDRWRLRRIYGCWKRRTARRWREWCWYMLMISSSRGRRSTQKLWWRRFRRLGRPPLRRGFAMVRWRSSWGWRSTRRAWTSRRRRHPSSRTGSVWT